MIFNQIYLYPELIEFDDDIVHPFRHQSRCICNFLERYIKPLKFKSPYFNRICVIGSMKPKPECTVNSCKVLSVEISFDKNEYLSLIEDNLNDYFIKLLTEGFTKCSKQYDIPLAQLNEGMKRFKLDGYKNVWVHKSKILRKLGVKCILESELTLHSFQLFLNLYKKDDLIARNEIFNSKPVEFCFYPQLRLLKNIGEENGYLAIKDKDHNIIFKLNIASLYYL